MASRAHRARLDADRVSSLANKTDPFLGAAVAYEPGFGYVLVGGEHRYAAAVRRGDREIKVYVLRSWRDMQAWMAWDKGQGEVYGHARWNAVEAAWFLDKAVPLLAVSRHDGAAEDVAEYTGVNRSSLDNARFATGIWNDASEPAAVHGYVENLLQEIVAGTAGASSIREKIKRERQRLEDLTKPRMPAAKQRAMLNETIATLSGVADGLAHLGDPHEDLTEEELAQYAATLGRINAKISKVKNTLRRGQA